MSGRQSKRHKKGTFIVQQYRQSNVGLTEKKNLDSNRIRLFSSKSSCEYGAREVLIGEDMDEEARTQVKKGKVC